MRSPFLIAMVCMTVAALTPGCAHPKVDAVPNSPLHPSWRDWIQLQPGWRVRVVIPILKSGGYIVKPRPIRADEAANGQHTGATRTSGISPHEITLSAGSDFIGYEVSWYTVKRRRGGGVRVVFNSAETHAQERVTHSRDTIRPMFRLPTGARWVRILHLLRGAPADHDAAILAANNLRDLDELTHQVELHPSACKAAQNTFCAWVPLGIAVIPESRIQSKGREEWEPSS